MERFDECVNPQRAASNQCLGRGRIAAYVGIDGTTRVRCRNCGKKRGIDQSECEHCGAVLKTPAKDGREIFESMEREVEAVVVA